MHPALIAAIVVSGAILCWGGYEAINTLYEWHNDRKEQREYEEYIRMHTEKGRYVPVTVFENDKEEESDDSDDDEPLAIWKQKRDSFNSQSELRQRQTTYQYDQFENSMVSPKNRISEMERPTSNELLLKQEEAELERRRDMLRSKGNSITGVIQDEQDINPFSDDFFIEKDSPLSPLLHNPFIEAEDNTAANNTTDHHSVTSSSPLLMNKSFNENNSQGDSGNLMQVSHKHSSSDLGSWSDVNEFTHSPNMKKSESVESFESIHHHQL